MRQGDLERRDVRVCSAEIMLVRQRTREEPTGLPALTAEVLNSVPLPPPITPPSVLRALHQGGPEAGSFCYPLTHAHCPLQGGPCIENNTLRQNDAAFDDSD
jgi:hypothetical protein